MNNNWKADINLETDRKLDEFDEKRHLTCTQIDHLFYMIYRDTEYRSHFPLAYNDKTVNERFVGYAGAIYNKDDDYAFFDEPFPQDVDIYICANGMKTPYRRGIDNLINIQNLVIDIDSHDSALTIDELNEHIEAFEKKLTKKLIVKPNLINRTGRGIHLWYFLEPCHVSLSKICLSVIDMLCTHISEIMAELNETELTIDKASSIKLNGLFRLPYSYNTKAKRWSECTMLHEDLQDINKFRKKLLKKGYKSNYFVDYAGKTKKKSSGKKINAGKYQFSPKINTNDYTPCLIHRKMFLEHLFETRDGKVGSRDLMIFAMYATLIQLFERDDAQARCIELNDFFEEPLSHSKLYEIFKDVDRKRYKFTVHRFLDLINATDEERAWYHKLSVKEERKKARRKAKEERNAKVKELYAQGHSVMAISKEMNLSRPTIYKIIQ